MSEHARQALQEAFAAMDKEREQKESPDDRMYNPQTHPPICTRCLQPLEDSMHGPMAGCTETSSTGSCMEPKAHHQFQGESATQWIKRVGCNVVDLNSGFVCSKPKGHTGDHIAHALTHHAARWA